MRDNKWFFLAWIEPCVFARRLFPETENTLITEEVKKLPDGK